MTNDPSPLHRRALFSRGALAAAGAVSLTTVSASSAQAAGLSFNPIEPYRAYDSREDGQNPVAENNGMYRIEVGSNTAAESKLPSGVRAITFNLTVAGTQSDGGFLSVLPGNVTARPNVSTLNWTSRGVVLANGGTISLGTSGDTNRHVNVYCGGGGRTPYLLDVTGYYA